MRQIQSIYTSVKILSFSLCFFTLITSCQKELHFPGIVQAGNSLAEYTLDGAPAACIAPVIQGNYFAGTALDSTNTVTITATVIRAGAYSISTNTVNGISFSATGTFSGTGSQHVTLVGSGTPLAAIASSFIPGTNGCVFNITVTTAQQVSPYFYEATIDGIYYKSQVDAINYDDFGGFNNPSGDSLLLFSYIANIIYPRPPGVTELGIGKGYIYPYSTTDTAEFSAFLLPGVYTYLQNTNGSGITIVWVDGEGKSWTSFGGDQTGSDFNITGSEVEPAQTVYSVRITATFNCKLYDNLGNSKILTNGKFVGAYQKA